MHTKSAISYSYITQRISMCVSKCDGSHSEPWCAIALNLLRHFAYVLTSFCLRLKKKMNTILFRLFILHRFHYIATSTY